MSSFRRLPQFLLVLAALVASLALAACGDDGDTTTTVIEETVTEGDTDSTVTETDSTTDSTTTESDGGPEDTTRAFLLALANGDGATACSYTSADAIAEIEVQGSCEEAVVAAAGEVTEEDVAQVESATYEVSEQTETSAVVTATRADGSAESFNLVVEDGEWKIAG